VKNSAYWPSETIIGSVFRRLLSTKDFSDSQIWIFHLYNSKYFPNVWGLGWHKQSLSLPIMGKANKAPVLIGAFPAPVLIGAFSAPFLALFSTCVIWRFFSTWRFSAPVLIGAFSAPVLFGAFSASSSSSSSSPVLISALSAPVLFGAFSAPFFGAFQHLC